MKRALAAGIGICAIAAVGLVGTAGGASAACVKTNLTTGKNGPGTTVNVSSSSSCNDLNLTKAYDHAGYEGYAGYYYKSSTGTWVRGSSGYHYTNNFSASSSSGWIVLLTDIGNGTKVGVASLWDAGDPVTVAH
jgi:hypothetical protein